MWKIIPNSSYISEPEVLQNLKQLLAKNICNCEICTGREKHLLLQKKDKEIQVTDQDFLNIIGQATSALKLHCTKSQTFTKNIFCPGCYMALNLCRQKDLKFLKDEESETKTEMFSRDKSTEKDIIVLEKSTSNTNKNEYKNAIVSPSEDLFEYSATSTTKIDNQKRKEVTLVDYQEGTLEAMPVYSNCLCMANFINSIRPPLSNKDIYDM